VKLTVVSMLLVTFLQGCGTTPSAPGDAAPSAAPAAAPPAAAARQNGRRKRALLIGINKYKNEGALQTLSGAFNDVDGMKQVLTSEPFGFTDVLTLKGPEASRERIFTAMESHLIDAAQPGDIVVLYFAGHGSRVRYDSDPGRIDNAIVPYDARDGTVRDITDKELNARVRNMAARVGDAGAVTIVLDSCHSASGVRGAVVRTAPDVRYPSPSPDAVVGPASAARSGYGDEGLKYALIAGSLTEQFSYERVDANGRAHGALTYYLTDELNKRPLRKRTYRDVMDVVISRVNREFPLQLPQLEGRDRNRVVFGDETVEAKSYVLARAASTPGLVELQAGSLHGITAQSEFDIYDPAAGTFEPPETPLTRVVVTAVSGLAATGTMTPAVSIPPGARAVERVHVYANDATPILYEGLEGSAVLRRLETTLSGAPNRPFKTVTAGEFRFRLFEKDGFVTVLGTGGEQLGAPLRSTAANLVQQIEDRLLAWDRWYSLLALDNPSSPIRFKVDFIPTGRATPIGRDEIASFTPGDDKFRMRVRNDWTRPIHIYIVDITGRVEAATVVDGQQRIVMSTAGAGQVYPPQNGQDPAIASGVTKDFEPGTTELPQGARHVRDTFKVIATSDPTNLSFLTFATPRGDAPRGNTPPDPLGLLFFNQAMAVRNGGFKAPSTWATADVVFDVCTALVGGRCVPPK
jgi:hypothetical protein